MDLQELIAKARAEVGVEAPTGSAEIEVGGELVEVVFRMVAGHVWADLTATNPPRAGSRQDSNVGYNTDAAANAYPVDHITVGGDTVDRETWSSLLEVLSSPSIKSIASCLWALNQLEPGKRIAELGKARAGALKKKQS